MLEILSSGWSLLYEYWLHIAGAVTIGVQLFAAGHAILHKRDSRAAMGWVGLIWLTPLLGALLYWLLGINRIRRKAHSLRIDFRSAARTMSPYACSPEQFAAHVGPDRHHFARLAHMMGGVTQWPLLTGNRVVPLNHASRAYPAMLEAIAGAQRCIALSSYIFNHDAAGAQFAEALVAAVARGVEVRVLIDDIGSRYKLPSIVWYFRRHKVPVARFMPAFVPFFVPYFNLRSHRKILLVDGRIGFTGGMNLRESGTVGAVDRHAISDLHFQVTGPIVEHLWQVFADDWHFTTGETLGGDSLRGDAWRLSTEPCGTVLARGVMDGPDENRDKLRLSILGALACAQRSVVIVTPYYLPDASIITALNVARMRGVEVDILLPAVNNLRVVQWASTAQLWQVLEFGCRVWLTAPPFDHTKLMLVDGYWTLLGSGNWDFRSLRLNFEFDVECYDAPLAAELDQLVRQKLLGARELTLADVDRRRLPVRLRDGVARLFTPYL